MISLIVGIVSFALFTMAFIMLAGWLTAHAILAAIRIYNGWNDDTPPDETAQR